MKLSDEDLDAMDFLPQAVGVEFIDLYPDSEVDQDLRIDVRVAVRKLPKKLQRILQLKAEGYNHREICKKLKIGPNTLQTHIDTIRTHLQDALKDYAFDKQFKDLSDE